MAAIQVDLSERAPNEDGIELDPVLLAAFCAWPPPSDGGPA